MTATEETVQQTLAEYERLAIGTGEWNGTDAPEFSNGLMNMNGDLYWSSAWAPTEDNTHPVFARARVYRKGVERPIEVVVRWDEAVPAVDEWHDLWMRKPVALCGAFTVRAALRRAFRDVIGDRREPDEPLDVPAPDGRSIKDRLADRDWIAELAEATTADAVRQLHADAKAARAVTVELEREFRKRIQSLSDIAIAAVAPVAVTLGIIPAPSVPQKAVMPSPASLANLHRPAPPKPPRKEFKPRPMRVSDVIPKDTERQLRELAAPARQSGKRRVQKPKPRGDH